MIAILKHAANEGPGGLLTTLRSSGCKTLIIELHDGQALPMIDRCRGIISLGGPMNVYEEDNYPFLKDEDVFLKQATKKGVPVLGICLGAQLLSKASGGKVFKSPVKEIGWGKVQITDDAAGDPLFEGLTGAIDVFQWHEDTFDRTSGGTLLATSDLCRNQAVRFGNSAWGLQYHPEMTLGMIEDWCKDCGNEEMLYHSISKYMEIESSYTAQADRLIGNFIRLAES